MILPAFKDAREFLGPYAMSFSELQTLSHCETKWNLIYNTQDRENYPATPAMELGSEMHRLLNVWWGHGAPLGWKDTENETAEWLMDRYDEHYMAQAGPYQMLQTDVPFAVQYHGYWLFGWFDGLLYDHEAEEYWVVEFKTMGNWSRLNQLPKDKQISLYIWAARQMGYNVKGVMFDAIRTYKWTGKNADSHTPDESFIRMWVERSDEELQMFLYEVDSALLRRSELYWNATSALSNVGNHCDWCPVMPACYGIDLELLDEFAPA